MSKTASSHANKLQEEFTLSNVLKMKNRHRSKMAALSIDEKIRIVEDLRERVKPIRKLRHSSME